MGKANPTGASQNEPVPVAFRIASQCRCALIRAGILDGRRIEAGQLQRRRTRRQPYSVGKRFMYEEFFGFHTCPFAAVPCADWYVPCEAIEHARQSLARAIEMASGPGLLIGSAGTGKTLLCLMLAEQFRGTFSVVTLSSARLATRRALLQNILFELGLPYRDRDEGELRLALMDHLEPSAACPHGLLLLVDEAHTLPLRLLEEIRLITNLTRDGLPRVRLVLAGGPQLEERFASPKLATFQQRIAARCYLHPLHHDETCEYVQRRLASATEHREEIFTPEALTAIHRVTEGIPRLINQVCDLALLMAAAGGKPTIDSAGIDEAWSDLQQLPAPRRIDEAAERQGAHVIEFGQLDDGPIDDATSGAAPIADAPIPQVQAERETASVTVGDSERETASVTESEQLPATIDEASSGADGEDFEPTIVPLTEQVEVQRVPPDSEALFHGPHELFGGAFEEEEVVIDRYASLGQGGESIRYRVASTEGRDLAAALREPPTVPDDAASAAARDARSDRAGDDSQRFEEPLDPASDPVMPEADALRDREAQSSASNAPPIARQPSHWESTEPDAPGMPARESNPARYYAEPTQPEWLAAADRADELLAEAQRAYPGDSRSMADGHREKDASRVGDSDADLIVVEDDPPAAQTIAEVRERAEEGRGAERRQPERPSSGARRMEYRQLFARLRRN